MDHRTFGSDMAKLSMASRPCPVCENGKMTRRGPVIEMSRSQQFDPKWQVKHPLPTYATLSCDACGYTEFYELTGISAVV
ncbi:MAG: hypothetical protein EOP09_03560 [Proteobacteria bacterium]|nr:MAG: hypothetical protein EOP09_03560 [Pseudomonadota bacterium]